MNLEVVGGLASIAEVATIWAAMELWQEHRYFSFTLALFSMLEGYLDGHYLWGHHSLFGLLP